MGLLNQEITVFEKPKNSKTNNIKIKCLSGYDAIREENDENNTLIIKQYVVVNDKYKRVNIGSN